MGEFVRYYEDKADAYEFLVKAVEATDKALEKILKDGSVEHELELEKCMEAEYRAVRWYLTFKS